MGITEHETWFGAINERAADLSRGVMPDVEVIQDYDHYVDGIDEELWERDSDTVCGLNCIRIFILQRGKSSHILFGKNRI